MLKQFHGYFEYRGCNVIVKCFQRDGMDIFNRRQLQLVHIDQPFELLPSDEPFQHDDPVRENEIQLVDLIKTIEIE